MKRILSAVAGVALCAGALAPAAHAQESPAGIAIVVPGQTVGVSPYGQLADALRSDGYLTTVLDVPGANMAADADRIAEAVTRARSDHPDLPISLVTHSVGAVSARYYLRDLGGADRVATYISIGAPQYGSPGACGQPAAPEVCPDTDFMRALNAGDDTPGPTAYYSIRSEREWTDGRLDGGQCRMTPFPTLGNGGVDHTLEPLLPVVQDQVRDALAGRCDGQFADEPDGAITPESTLFPSGIRYG
ncbi:alpha/beta hydrolase family protein [Nocardia nova SH22a]|uniref:Alpha/beta hydrolase family protein n=1 Tax=Nocardia nova SH22a TaxID=1415166 RepID=W5TV87_9NOCA|nr:lipase [Nocardia nova]AHH21086.1 alpha/beta hydrolase family protein [Nocardia nova SH22a]